MQHIKPKIKPPQIEQGIRDLLQFVGEDPDREGLQETPKRVRTMFEFLTSGYEQDPKEILKTFSDGAQKADEMVFQTLIPFYSLCCHHVLPFFGYAHLAYIPNQKVVGLSKLSRLVEIFTRRLQIQEALCNEIADALFDNLQPLGVGVTMQARHLCIESRGVQKVGTVTVTTALRGVFKEKPEVRAEFLSIVNSAMLGIKIL